MKKHLDLDVTGLTALSQRQFPAAHETPLADFGFQPVLPGDEKDLRRLNKFESMDVVKRIPHSQIRAGQMVVSTQRAHDMADKPPGGMGEAEQLPNGEYMVTDGHHRLVADHLRGRKTTRLRVTGKYTATNPPWVG